MFTKQKLAYLCFWISTFIPLLGIVPFCDAKDRVGEDLDEKIAFDVPGQQKPISVAPLPTDHSTGYIVYCPCMGKVQLMF